ncbi:hypothetical protein [Laspinema olomoucense]|nr:MULTISPECIES: hypothetical protein [unclassified Laspinema]
MGRSAIAGKLEGSVGWDRNGDRRFHPSTTQLPGDRQGFPA